MLLVHNCEHRCQSGGKATQWTADPFYPGSIPGSGLKVFSKIYEKTFSKKE